MKAVTIDNLDIKDHVRWAEDQARLDPVYFKKSPIGEHHPEILWTSGAVASKWEELFAWQHGVLSWAAFAPPPKYHLVSKRLFSYRLFPQIFWEEEKEEEEGADHEHGEDQEKKQSSDLLKQVIALEKSSDYPSGLFEKDKTSILSLLELIKYLNSLLGQIHARKLQYQKG